MDIWMDMDRHRLASFCPFVFLSLFLLPLDSSSFTTSSDRDFSFIRAKVQIKQTHKVIPARVRHGIISLIVVSPALSRSVYVRGAYASGSSILSRPCLSFGSFLLSLLRTPPVSLHPFDIACETCVETSESSRGMS